MKNEPLSSVNLQMVKSEYRIPFLNGLRDGKFSFYYPDETLELTGDYKEGVRNGEFISYGRIGELVYKKNFANGILDGNFSLYYPASNHDVYKFKELKEESKLDLKVKDHLRLKTTFRNGNPSGNTHYTTTQEIGNIWKSMTF